MAYTSYDKLSTMKIYNPVNYLFIKDFEYNLLEKPAYAIYIEYNDKLYGVVTVDDIEKAWKDCKDKVKINKKYKKLKKNELYKALVEFHDNKKINTIAVVDDDNNLIGEFSRWNEEVYSFYSDPLYELCFYSIYTQSFKGYDVILVETDNINGWEKTRFEEFKSYFQNNNIKYRVVNKYEIHKNVINNDYPIILFATENELRGLKAAYCFIYNNYTIYNNIFLSTYTTLLENKAIKKWKIFGEYYQYFHYLQNNGVHVYTLNPFGNLQYYFDLVKNVYEKNDGLGRHYLDFTSIIYRSFKKDLFQDLYSEEEIKELINNHHPSCIKNGIYQLKDTQSKFYNVKNGCRVTTDQKENESQEIFFFGPCIAIGLIVEDKNTIESLLQKKLNELGYNIKVSNYGVFTDALFNLYKIEKTKIKKNDIVIYCTYDDVINGIPTISIYDIFDKYKTDKRWFIDSCFHTNHLANKDVSEGIYDYIKNDLTTKKTKNTNKIIKYGGQIPQANAYLYTYFRYFDKSKYKNIGSIIMNCNPFTNGHKYLIEKALKQVDYLIIFVVEEDKSIIPFDLRYSMVREAANSYKNVYVVPSGNIILSNTTFPEYFVKIYDEDIVKNIEFDITMFAKYIANPLGINYRFVGEEKEDKVTREYNKQMKKILPKYGIKLVEIPRTANDNGDIISATKVRKLIENNDIEKLKEYVPKHTIDYLYWKM